MSNETSGQARRSKRSWIWFVLQIVALFLLFGYLGNWQYIPLNYTRFIGSMETATQIQVDMRYRDRARREYRKIDVVISDPEQIRTLVGFFKDPQPMTEIVIEEIVNEEASSGTEGTITADTPQGLKIISFSNTNLVSVSDPDSIFSKKGIFMLHAFSQQKVCDWLKSIGKLE